MNGDNPYCSPAWTGSGAYDHWLWRRFLRACLVIGICFLLLDLLSAAIYLGSVNPVAWCSALSDNFQNDATRILERFFNQRM